MRYKLVRKTSSARTAATRTAIRENKPSSTRHDTAKLVEEPDDDDIRDEVNGSAAAAVSTTAAATSRSHGERNERDSDDQGQELYVDPAATEVAGTTATRSRSWMPPRPRMPVLIPTTRSKPRNPKTSMKKTNPVTQPAVSKKHPRRTIEGHGTEKIVPLHDSNQQLPEPPSFSSTSSHSLLPSSSSLHRKKLTSSSSSQKKQEKRSPLLDAVMVECIEDDETIVVDGREKMERNDGQQQFQDTEEEEVGVDDQSLELACDVPIDRQRSAGTETDGEGEYYSGSEYYSDNDDEYDYDEDYVEDEYDDDYDHDDYGDEEEEPKNGWFGNGFGFGGMMVGAGAATGGAAAVAVNNSKNGNHRSRSHLSSTTGSQHRGVAPRDTDGLAEVESPNSMEPLVFAPVKDESDNEVEGDNDKQLQEKPDDAKEIGLEDYKKQQRLDTRQKWMQFLTLQGRLPMRRSTATWNRKTEDQHKRQLEVKEQECEESGISATDDPEYASAVKSSVDTTSGTTERQRRKWRPLLALKMAGASIQRRFQMKVRNKQRDVAIRSEYSDDDDDDETLSVYSKELTAAPVKTEDNEWDDWLSFWTAPFST